MRKLNGITINGEFLGNGVVINGLFRAICAISPVIMREFVLIINKIDVLEEAVKISNFNCDNDKNCMDIEFENSTQKGVASLYFELLEGEPELTDCKLLFDNVEYSTTKQDEVSELPAAKSTENILVNNLSNNNPIRQISEQTGFIDAYFPQNHIGAPVNENKESTIEQKLQELVDNTPSCISEENLREFLDNNEHGITDEELQEFLDDNPDGISEENLREFLGKSEHGISDEDLQTFINNSQDNVSEQLIQELINDSQDSGTSQKLQELLDNNKNGVSKQKIQEIIDNQRANEEILEEEINENNLNISSNANTYSNGCSSLTNSTVSNSYDSSYVQNGNYINNYSGFSENISQKDDMNCVSDGLYKSGEQNLLSDGSNNQFRHSGEIYSSPMSTEVAEKLTKGLTDAITQGFQGIAKELSIGLSQGLQAFQGFGGGQAGTGNQFSGDQFCMQGNSGLINQAPMNFNNGQGGSAMPGTGYMPAGGYGGGNFQSSGMPNNLPGNSYGPNGVGYGPQGFPNGINPNQLGAIGPEGMVNLYSELLQAAKQSLGNQNMQNNENDPAKMQLEALRAELDAIKSKQADNKLMSLEEFMAQQREIQETRDKIRKSKIRIVGSGGRVNAKALENGVYVAGQKIYKWGNTRQLDE